MPAWKELGRKVTENLKTSFDFEYFNKCEYFKLFDNLKYLKNFRGVDFNI